MNPPATSIRRPEMKSWPCLTACTRKETPSCWSPTNTTSPSMLTAWSILKTEWSSATSARNSLLVRYGKSATDRSRRSAKYRPASGSYESWFSTDIAVAYLLAAVAVALQMATNGRYGYFRDELYYLALSHHLAWGYVDLAPMAPLVVYIGRVLFGDSLHALRLLPALALGAEILITGLITRELGGRRFAVLLACLGVLVAPVILANAARFSMNPFEPLFWMGAIYFLLLAINRDRPQFLVWAGVLVGLGLENKHSTAFFLIALLVGLLATSQRCLFRSKWLWIAAGIIVLLALPNLIWQYRHGFPTWVDLSNVKKIHKNIELPPLPFLKEQIMMLQPLNAVIWIAGLGFLLFHSEGKRYRVLGVTYLAFLAIMMVLHGKDYYLAPIYPMLFAAGGVFWQKLIAAHSRLRWV